MLQNSNVKQVLTEVDRLEQLGSARVEKNQLSQAADLLRRGSRESLRHVTDILPQQKMGVTHTCNFTSTGNNPY